MVLRGDRFLRRGLVKAVRLPQLQQIILELLLNLPALKIPLDIRQLRLLLVDDLRDFRIRRRLGGNLLRHEDQMPAERGFHRRIDLADILLECGLVELRHHLPVAERAEVATPVLGGTVGLLLREFRELLRKRITREAFHLAVERVNLLLGGIAVLLVVRLDEDMRRAHLFGHRGLRPLGDVGDDHVVLLLDLLLVNDDLGLDFLLDELLDQHLGLDFRAHTLSAHRVLLQEFLRSGRGAGAALEALDDVVQELRHIRVRDGKALLRSLVHEQRLRNEPLLVLLRNLPPGALNHIGRNLLHLFGGHAGRLHLDELVDFGVDLAARELGVAD